MDEKLVLINPMDCYTPQFTMRNTVPTILLILATYIKKYNNIDVEILDLAHKFSLDKRDEMLSKYLEKYRNYKFFGISCVTSNFYHDCLYIASKIREINSNAFIFIGGRHPTIKPKDFIFPKSPFDYIFSGEAEIELSKVIDNLNNKKNEYKKPKIIYCAPIQIKDFINTNWNYAESLDFINNPKADNYIRFPVYLSRGCPFTCKFCSDPKNKLTLCYKSWRKFPLENALQELTSIYDLFHKRNNLKYEISISDPLFGTPHYRIKLYSDLIKHTPDQYYNAEIRVDTFKPDEEIPYLKQLKFSLSFGLESGSVKMLKIMDKTPEPEKFLEKMKHIATLLDENQIYFIPNILIGHPGENYKTLKETSRYLEEMAKNKRFCMPQFIKYMLHPSSEIYRNMENYEKNFGTKFFVKEWWMAKINQIKLSQLVNPSKELHIIDLYYEMQKIVLKIYKIMTVNKIGQRSDMRDIRQNFYQNIIEQITFWKRAPEEFKKYLRDNFPKFLSDN